MRSVEEQLAAITANAAMPAPVRIAISESLGLLCAEDVVAERPLPGFVQSAIDGYAVRAVDVRGESGETLAEFDEVTLVLAGTVLVDHDGGQACVRPGQSLITRAGERIRYSVGDEGAEYIAVCLPAFSPEAVHREE